MARICHSEGAWEQIVSYLGKLDEPPPANHPKLPVNVALADLEHRSFTVCLCYVVDTPRSENESIEDNWGVDAFH